MTTINIKRYADENGKLISTRVKITPCCTLFKSMWDDGYIGKLATTEFVKAHLFIEREVMSVTINYCPFCGHPINWNTENYSVVPETEDKVKRNSESYCTPEVMEAIRQTRGDVR